MTQANHTTNSTPALLNDDGTASMATAIMMSHHGLRRDLQRFAIALDRVASGDSSRIEALKDEWKNYRNTLHGHHEAEDKGLFPSLRSQHTAVAATIDALSADHRRIDPLLERADAAFTSLPSTEVASALVKELESLLGPHLATEEAELVPFLRPAKTFPAPATEADAELYAKGFSWAMHGVAPEVIEQVYKILPESLCARLPAARAEFAARCERVWGTARAGATRTPIPTPEG
jgi:hypothetical protein